MSKKMNTNFSIKAPKPIRDTDLVGCTLCPYATKEDIPAEMRHEFMMTTDELGKVWRLEGGVDNTNWTEYKSGETDHGALTGLSDDDHTQYLPTDGSRPLTGDLDADGNALTNIADGIQLDDASSVGQTTTMVNDLRDEVEAALQDKADVVHTHPISDVTGLQGELDDRYTKGEHIQTSTGTNDAGKPIILDSDGRIDDTMLAMTTFIYIGAHNPAYVTEYPSTTGLAYGSFWVVDGLSSPYTFTGGDLAGEVAENGDYMLWGQNGWQLRQTGIDPELYYHLDGSKPLEADLAGGGHKVSNIADGTQLTDGATVGQTSTMVQDLRNESESGDQNLQDQIDDHLGDTANPHDVTFAQLPDTPSTYPPESHTHTENEITDLDKFNRGEFIPTSTGVGDAGKPILLNGQGQIDPSMLDTSTFYYVGVHDPSGGTEYPDLTGETHGAFWVVQNLTAPYTFTGGELVGLEIDNGDFMVWGTGGWSIMRGEMNPLLYYKLDGTQSLTGDFAGGGYKITNIANGMQVSDGATVGQVSNMDQDVRDEFEAADQDIIDDLTAHTGDTANPHGTSWSNLPGKPTEFPPSTHTHEIGDVNGLQGALDGKEDDLGNPTTDGYVLSSTAAGARSWIEMSGGGGAGEIYPGIDADLYEFHGSTSFENATAIDDLYLAGFSITEPNDFSAYIVQKEIDSATGELLYFGLISVIKLNDNWSFQGNYTVGTTDNDYARFVYINNSSPYDGYGLIIHKDDTAGITIEMEVYVSKTDLPASVIYGDGVTPTVPSGSGVTVIGSFGLGEGRATTGQSISSINLFCDIEGSSSYSTISSRIESRTVSSPSMSGYENFLQYESGDIDGILNSVILTGTVSTMTMKGTDPEGGGGLAYFHDTAIPAEQRFRVFKSDVLGSGANNVWDVVGIVPVYPETGGAVDKFLNQQGLFIEISGSGVPEAPEDGTLYGRIDAGWARAATEDHLHPAADITDFQGSVSSNTDVSANTGARHTHSNLTLLETLTDGGTGDLYLADDGSYKGIPGGISTFKALTDTPNDYTGMAGNKVVVNDAEDGLDYITDIDMGTVEYNYRFDTDTNATEPTSGRIKVNNIDYALATEVYASETDRNGNMRDGAWHSLDHGDVLILRDNNSDKGIVFQVNSNATDNGTWATVPVTFVKEIAPLFNSGERMIVGMIFLGLKDAPSDGSTYGRLNGTWEEVVPASGGSFDGIVTIEGANSDELGTNRIIVKSDINYTSAQTELNLSARGIDFNIINPSTGWSRAFGRALINDVDDLGFGVYGSTTNLSYMWFGESYDNSILKIGKANSISIGGSGIPNSAHKLEVFGNTQSTTFNGVPLTTAGTATHFLAGDGTYKAVPEPAETDPVFTASPAGGIVAGDITNWDTAFGWGDHSTEGYLTSFTETDPIFTASPAANVIDSGTGSNFLADDGTYKAVSSGGVPEAPEDTKTYGRKDGAWTEVVPTTGGSFIGKITGTELDLKSSTFPVSKTLRLGSSNGDGTFNTTAGINSGILSYTKHPSVNYADLNDGYGGGFVFTIGGADDNDAYIASHTIGRIYARKDGAGGAILLDTGNDVDMTKSLIIRSSGFVGIGTTEPTEMLDVVGNVKATNFNGVPLTDAGTATHFLAGDGTYKAVPPSGGDFMADGSVPMTGTLQTDGHLTHDIGETTNRWNNLYASTGNFTNSVSAQQVNVNGKPVVANTIDGTTHAISLMWTGDQAQYDALSAYDPETLYFIE